MQSPDPRSMTTSLREGSGKTPRSVPGCPTATVSPLVRAKARTAGRAEALVRHLAEEDVAHRAKHSARTGLVHGRRSQRVPGHSHHRGRVGALATDVPDHHGP